MNLYCFFAHPIRFIGVATLLLCIAVSGHVATAQAQAQTYEDRVQQAYLAYYGRPGDYQGVRFWTGQLEAAGGDLDAIIDAFGDSREFQDRFGTLNNAELIQNIYRQVLGREADQAGLTFYLAGLWSGSMSLATIALNVVDGVQPGSDDYLLLANKVTVAKDFARTTQASGRIYGDAQIDEAREILNTVSTEPESVTDARALMDSALALFPFADPASTPDDSSPSVARRWNDLLLEAIRNDLARPTVHARNLFHISAAMYDAWSIYDPEARPYLLGNQLGEFHCPLRNFPAPADIQAAREQAVSYAAYRMLVHRFRESPGASETFRDARRLMLELRYSQDDEDSDYTDGSAAAMGNHIADCYIEYGLQDGANEAEGYANTFYEPFNPPIRPEESGNPDIVDLDRWQAISLTESIDQSGNQVEGTPEFIGAEWGRVAPFSLQPDDRTVYRRDDLEFQVYLDPGPPPSTKDATIEDYQWGFSLVSIWSSHLDPEDGVMIDISPAAIGNIEGYPDSISDYPGFYDYLEGGDASRGYAVNPVTGAPYTPQLVPRADYARVLAEFWADGPDSETPPGHWFVILNEVADHPQFDKRIGGVGSVAGSLEWDVKAYFALGGAMHDSAIAAWSLKGWYDYLRPVSAIRAMADRGQSSDPSADSYSVDGLPLVPGFIELVRPGDPLAGRFDANVGKIKLYAWAGPDYIGNPASDRAGVRWILAEDWWPYQRPTFVTPPFAGYVSGHSTFSRAAAEVLTALSGSAYFPGGLSEFEIRRNDFLVFEQGPSVDMTLQWATYRDASDQTSLSRIWGGIHPPADDIPGRVIGEEIGQRAYSLAEDYFSGRASP
jgi:hypothetical protein